MFTTELLLRADPAPDYWVLATPLVWQDLNTWDVTIPAGFRTDLASIPRIFRNLPFLDPNGLSRRPAVLHDYLYNGGDRQRLQMTRARADGMLRAALRAEGASRVVAWIFWAGVRLGGWVGWAD